MKRVLIVIDVQNDFIDGSLGSNASKEVIVNIENEVLKKDEYQEILLTRDTHNEEYEKTYEGKNLPIKHCYKGSNGWEIKNTVMNAVKASNIQYSIFDKNTFACVEMINYLKKEIQNIESVTIIGLYLDICVVTNALLLRSYFKDLPIYYIENCTAATKKENFDATLKVLNACQIFEK